MEFRIVNENDNIEEIIEIMSKAGFSDYKSFKKYMLGYLASNFKSTPDLDYGIVYGIFDENNKVIAGGRLKQCDYTSSVVSIEYIAVKKELRGKGIGNLLLNNLFNEIKETYKKSAAMLATDKSTHEFYEKCGMEVIGKINKDNNAYRYFLHKWL